MSLLMDALRKAEEAKRAASGNVAGSPESFSGIAVDTPLTAGIPAELALEPLAHEPLGTPAEKASPAASQPAQPRQVQRDAINNVFAAKTRHKDPADRAFMVALVCVASLGFLGICGYIWWQMQPRSSLSPKPAPLTTAAPAVMAAPPSVQPSPSKSEPSAESVHDSALAAITSTVASIATSISPPVKAPAPEQASPIRITHSQSRVNPLLEQGYTALQQGNTSQAQQAYERMLASDPKNLDALYGLSAIAMQRQQLALAEDYYLRILEVDPRDVIAHAGLTGLKGKSGGAESRIKTLIAEQPNVPQLHFALGNLYAQEQRWRDAQQAYFLAYRNDNENPDAAFNLAVSLDQLHQDRLAAQYYGEALRLAVARPAAFSREQAQARLLALQGQGAQ